MMTFSQFSLKLLKHVFDADFDISHVPILMSFPLFLDPVNVIDIYPLSKKRCSLVDLECGQPRANRPEAAPDEALRVILNRHIRDRVH
jgi:hypothetical protein